VTNIRGLKNAFIPSLFSRISFHFKSNFTITTKYFARCEVMCFKTLVGKQFPLIGLHSLFFHLFVTSCP
jgi:hypothetical protein